MKFFLHSESLSVTLYLKKYQKTLILAFEANSALSCQNGLFFAFQLIVTSIDGVVFVRRTNNFLWCPVDMASCTFVPILSNNTEKELVLGRQYYRRVCGHIHGEYQCIYWGRGHVDKNSQHVYLQQKEPGADGRHGTKHLLNCC